MQYNERVRGHKSGADSLRVVVFDGDIIGALRRLRKAVDTGGLMTALRDKEHAMKPSERRRRKRERARARLKRGVRA